VPKLAQDGSTVNIMEHVVVVVGHIWEATIIKEYIVQTFATLEFWTNPNWGVPFRLGELSSDDLRHGFL
jgi:hypothetical protein